MRTQRASQWAAVLVLVCAGLASWGECPIILGERITGYPESAVLDEISGIAASRANPGVLWVHNDSGGTPVVYALAEDGRLLGAFTLDGATLIDWEGIALGPGPVPGVDYLYIGDVGDNAFARPSVTVYRIAEPQVDAEQAFVSETVPAETFTLVYPGAPDTVYNCEAVMVDPPSGDLWLFTKDSSGSENGVSHLFRNASPLLDGESTPLIEEGSINVGFGLLNQVTGGDISPIGDAILVRTYSRVLWWERPQGASVAQAMDASPCELPSPLEIQGEAISFGGDGLGYYTTSEQPLGDPEPIYYFEQLYVEEEGAPDCANHTGGLFEEGDDLCLRLPDALSPAPPFTWRKDGTPLESDGRIRGAASRSLAISSLVVPDSGSYTCTYEDAAKTTQVFGPVRVTVGVDVPAASTAGLAMLAGALSGVFLAVRRRVDRQRR